MQNINTEGLARAIGVSNFHPDRLVDLIDHNEIVPAVNQIETHPFHQRAADQELMRERGVQIESWGPFAEGRNNLFTDPVLSAIAEAHGKSVAQVVLRWLIQRGVVVIPKSVRPERMAQNLDVFDFDLTEEQMTRIAALDTGASLFFDHRDPAMVSWLGGRRMRLMPAAHDSKDHGRNRRSALPGFGRTGLAAAVLDGRNIRLRAGRNGIDACARSKAPSRLPLRREFPAPKRPARPAGIFLPRRGELLTTAAAPTWTSATPRCWPAWSASSSPATCTASRPPTPTPPATTPQSPETSASKTRTTGRRSAAPLPSIDQYDTVLLASGIWNVRAPMIMTTFAERYDFTGKSIHPVTTHAMSGLGTTERDYAESCPGDRRRRPGGAG